MWCGKAITVTKYLANELGQKFLPNNTIAEKVWHMFGILYNAQLSAHLSNIPVVETRLYKRFSNYGALNVPVKDGRQNPLRNKHEFSSKIFTVVSCKPSNLCHHYIWNLILWRNGDKRETFWICTILWRKKRRGKKTSSRTLQKTPVGSEIMFFKMRISRVLEQQIKH